MPQIATQTPLSIASVILLINGSLLVGVSTLVQLISKMFMEHNSDDDATKQKKKHSRFYLVVMIFSTMLILLGIGLLIINSTYEDQKFHAETPSVDTDINVILSTEQEVDITTEAAKPDPSVSKAIVEPTPSLVE